MMPKRLLLVRHGKSEKNEAQGNPEFAKIMEGVPDNEARLTPKGVEQAQVAGEWLRNYLPDVREKGEGLHGYYSPFVRTKETSGHLRLGLRWKHSPFIIERYWGDFEQLAAEEQKKHKANKKRNPLYAQMPNGQSISNLLPTNHIFFGMLHREHPEDTVVAVCHGERLFSIRYQLERMSDEQFGEVMRSSRKSLRIRNCQILEYTREHPETGLMTNSYQWMCSFCPWDLREKDLQWKSFEAYRPTDDELLADAHQYPRYLS